MGLAFLVTHGTTNQQGWGHSDLAQNDRNVSTRGKKELWGSSQKAAPWHGWLLSSTKNTFKKMPIINFKLCVPYNFKYHSRVKSFTIFN